MGALRSIIVLRINLVTSRRKKCTAVCIVALFYRSSMAHACCQRLTEVVGQNRIEPLPLVCRACASCGAHRNHMATQPSSGPSASPVAVIFAPLVSVPAEVCLRLQCPPVLEARASMVGIQPDLPSPWVFLSCPVQKLLIILNYLLVLWS